MRLYHGTSKEFTNFTKEKMFFTDCPIYAETYTKVASLTGDGDYMAGASIIPVQVEDFGKCLEIDAKGNLYLYIKLSKENINDLTKSFLGTKYENQIEDLVFPCSTNDITTLAKWAGYDSVIIKNVEDLGSIPTNGKNTTNVYVFLNKGKIKSNLN